MFEDGYQRALMAGERLLTEMQCRGAKASSKVRYLNDGGGLRVRVRPDGSRHCIYRFQFNKKEKNTSLGAYPQVSLTQVRDIAIETRY